MLHFIIPHRLNIENYAHAKENGGFLSVMEPAKNEATTSSVLGQFIFLFGRCRLALFSVKRPVFISTSAFAQLDAKDFREVPVADPRNTLVGLLYTSGTTGMPKGVEVSHHSFVAHMVQSR
ncbi:hypothetical protein HPB48_026611 [Haemaphysalis longicornis]|uniref:AMP-dependent synthetase/ligase domain-containing protein n=1 Tax=Haemaphysalis longicornis TaxID=44386 RepID=A0A9J6HBY1_HAELO|nr:hypothetical protein HPB48_026611 [Haemaphysalis longicornis]